jgi:hypothetical protein
MLYFAWVHTFWHNSMKAAALIDIYAPVSGHAPHLACGRMDASSSLGPHASKWCICFQSVGPNTSDS